MVKIHYGHATVNGDESQTDHCIVSDMGRLGK